VLDNAVCYWVVLYIYCAFHSIIFGRGGHFFWTRCSLHLKANLCDFWRIDSRSEFHCYHPISICSMRWTVECKSQEKNKISCLSKVGNPHWVLQWFSLLCMYYMCTVLCVSNLLAPDYNMFCTSPVIDWLRRSSPQW